MRKVIAATFQETSSSSVATPSNFEVELLFFLKISSESPKDKGYPLKYDDDSSP